MASSTCIQIASLIAQRLNAKLEHEPESFGMAS
jgi:hypothetical protein